MVTTIDFNENELKFIEEISAKEGIRTRAECVRFCIKEAAKKILPKNTTDIVISDASQEQAAGGLKNVDRR